MESFLLLAERVFLALPVVAGDFSGELDVVFDDPVTGGWERIKDDIASSITCTHRRPTPRQARGKEQAQNNF